MTRAQALLLATLCAGCGGSPAMGMDAGVDAAPALDPRLFDCTSLGADGMHLPERASAIPAACALDPACRTPQISGHRGVGGMTGNLGKIAPEDTLAAYRAAIALGIEFVETDPRPTADGVLVNMHDDSVERTTDGTGSVSQLSFATIRALHINPQGVPGDYACEKVPTLTEILKTCRGRVVVLIDANKTDRVDLLVQAVREADALDWAVFDTSSVDKIDQALKIEPKLRFMNRPASIAEITAQFDHWKPRVPVIVELHTDERVVGSAIVHQRGSRVLSDVFLEDAAARLQGNLTGYGKALDDGVDILQTDAPELVQNALVQRRAR